MALGTQVTESLKEAEANLRNALAFAARGEKSFIAKHIADMILSIDSLIETDAMMDKLQNRKFGDSGMFGSFFDRE
jgi:hypothetical protein